MHNEDNEKYLGDIVTNDGKNKKNIRARVNKGRGIANDLLETLVKMLAGAEHHKKSSHIKKCHINKQYAYKL